MTSAHDRRLRLAFFCVLSGLLALSLVIVPAAHAADFVLNWSAIGFVDGTSSLQTFTDVNGSGVDMTTEFRVLDADFQDIGPYVPGSTELNQGMPKPVGDALAVRDISTNLYPGGNVGYVLTKITFSQGITISDLWMESFYDWADAGVRKHLALQAFDENGQGVTPVDWTIYGASDLVVQPHPINGQPWLRSSYADDQNVFTGASGIDFGNQSIRELYWYSWGYAADGSLSNLLGSTYLGDFEFSVEPTAVSLVSARAVDEPGAGAAILAALALVALTTVAVVQERRGLAR